MSPEKPILYQIVKKRLSDVFAKRIPLTFFNDVFTTYLCIHGCIRLVLNQRFLITYSLLIFVCVGCLAHQLKINRKYTTTKQWLGTNLHQFRNDPLNQRFFLMTYSSLIFVWFLYALRMSMQTKNKREYTTIKLWLRTNCARYHHLTSLKLA